jgi:hypothetical protein
LLIVFSGHIFGLSFLTQSNFFFPRGFQLQTRPRCLVCSLLRSCSPGPKRLRPLLLADNVPRNACTLSTELNTTTKRSEHVGLIQ